MSDEPYKDATHRNATKEDIRALKRLAELAMLIEEARAEALGLQGEIHDRHGGDTSGVWSLDAEEAFAQIFCASYVTRGFDGDLRFKVPEDADS